MSSRILVHDFSGHPFQLQLSRALAARGYSVLHIYCADYVSGRGAVQRQPSDPTTLEIRSIGMGREWDRYTPGRRIRQELAYAATFNRLLTEWAPDLVVTCNVPLFAAHRTRRRMKRLRIPQVYWLQDLYSVGISSALWQRSGAIGRWLTPMFVEMEAMLLRESAAVIAITSDFLPVLSTWHIDPSRVAVLPNWAPIDELPVRPKRNPWSVSHRYADRPIVMYAGTLGLKHDHEKLLHLAEAMATSMPSARLVVISEGPSAQYLASEATRQDLDNLDVLSFQPWPEMPDVLATADVLLLLLSEDAGAFSVPSKLATYLCAGRPIVAAVPRSNLSARLVETAGAGELVESPDPEDLATGVLRLLANSDRRNVMGAAARAYAEEHFYIDDAVAVFERAFEQSPHAPCQN